MDSVDVVDDGAEGRMCRVAGGNRQSGSSVQEQAERQEDEQRTTQMKACLKQMPHAGACVRDGIVHKGEQDVAQGTVLPVGCQEEFAAEYLGKKRSTPEQGVVGRRDGVRIREVVEKRRVIQRVRGRRERDGNQQDQWEGPPQIPLRAARLGACTIVARFVHDGSGASFSTASASVFGSL